MGAVLSTRIANSIAQVIPVMTITFWTDSTNVLFWVRNQSRNFKPFVANRVGEIQRTTDPEQWRHVPGKENPADLPTQGLSAKDLVDSVFWKEGPESLKADVATWPEMPKVPEKFEQSEEKKMTGTHLTKKPDKDTTYEVLINPVNYSSYQRLIHVTAWCQRFINNCRLPKERRTSEKTLTSRELIQCDVWWLHRAQTDAFPDREEQKSLAALNPK